MKEVKKLQNYIKVLKLEGFRLSNFFVKKYLYFKNISARMIIRSTMLCFLSSSSTHLNETNVVLIVLHVSFFDRFITFKGVFQYEK